MLGPTYTTVAQTTFSKSKKLLITNKKKRNISIVSYSVIEPSSDLAIRKLSELTDFGSFAGHHMTVWYLHI